MGKNLYETPRNKNKWHTQDTKSSKSSRKADDKVERLEKLKDRFKKQK